MTSSERPADPGPPATYSHEPEAAFEDQLADWFRARYGDDAVQQQYHLGDPDWYCDIVVHTGYATLYIETESRASEIRPGLAQAQSYAADDPATGVPVVVCPVGHFPDNDSRIEWMRESTTVPIRMFDPEAGVFVDEATTETQSMDEETHTDPDSVPETGEWKPAKKKPAEVDYRGPYYNPAVVDTLEGEFEVDEEYADQGFVIIRGVEGEIYPCRLDIFEETYYYAE